MPACESGPAPLSARGHLGRRRRQLRPVLRARHQGRAVPVRRRRTPRPSRRASSCPSRPTRSGTATCPTCCPGSSTATASTARTSRAPATGSTRTRWSSTPTPRRSAAIARWDDELFGYPIGAREQDLVARRARQRRLRPAGRGGADRRSPGATTARRARPGTRRSSTRCTSRGSPSGTPTCPETLRGTYAGPGVRAGHRAPDVDLGVTAVELLPVHHHVDDRHLVEQRADQLLGLQHARLLRPRRRATPPRRHPQRGAASSRRWSAPCTRPASRSSSTWSTTTPPRATSWGPTLSLRGIDNASYYRLSPRGPALLHGLHRLRQHAEHAAPARAAAHHGQPALLGAGDARRRLPLRPGQHAGPRAVRGEQAGRVLRHHPPGPGPVAGEADRRAVGRRAGRLPGRQLPACCGPSGTASTATPSGSFWKGDGGTASASSPRGWPARSDLYERSGRRPYASINFVTCHDGFTLHDLVSYNQKHNEANGEDNRDGADDNTQLELRRRGADRRRRRSCALRERQKRNLHRHAAALAGRADDLRRRRAGPHPAAATTTPTARTTS